MLDQMIRNTFDDMAGADQPPAQVSVVQAIKQASAQRRRQRLAAVGTPLLAAGAVLAIALSGVIGSGLAGAPTTTPGNSSHAAPKAFNPLVPYAAVGWYPYRVSYVSGDSYPTALRFIATGLDRGNPTTIPWTSTVIYAANQCVLATPRLSCGSLATGTGAVLTMGGRAPDVGRHPAYWIQDATGDLTPDVPSGARMVAFEYARHGWAFVTSSGTPNDAIRIAENVRFGRATPLRLPVRLTGLPPAWRDVQLVQFQGSGSQYSGGLALSRYPQPAIGYGHDLLYVNVGVGKTPFPGCSGESQTLCRSKVIDGYKVLVEAWSAPPREWLTAPDADGLNLQIEVTGPALQQPTWIFARDLQLLGPNPAHWTSHPVG
jgi:hypothetical protein